ncbi:MAG: hypothetical protein DMD43_07040 [Gemmatimonadetes bacterium]|nr:MAG: hypothetical protein DMD43_07040 [Gemmatimonadota bacterium]
MRGGAAALALALALPGSACDYATRRASLASTCPAGWNRQVSHDSIVELCTPPGFNAGASSLAGAYTWKRPAAGAGDSDWVAVAIVADSTRHETWPPPLESPADCRTDCYTVDSAAVHTDTAGLVAVRLETGLVSGGNEGARRAARLAGGWITPHRTRILVVGAAELGMTLDTLRTALRTLRVRAP